MSEKNLQLYLFAQATKHKVYCRKMASPSRVGFPDVMLAYAGAVVFVELKSPTKKGRLSKMQEREIEKMLAVGLTVRVIDTKGMVDDVIREILKPKTTVRD